MFVFWCGKFFFFAILKIGLGPIRCTGIIYFCNIECLHKVPQPGPHAFIDYKLLIESPHHTRTHTHTYPHTHTHPHSRPLIYTLTLTHTLSHALFFPLWVTCSAASNMWVIFDLFILPQPSSPVCEWRGVTYNRGEVFGYRDRCITYQKCECVGIHSPAEIYCWGHHTYVDLHCIIDQNLILDTRRIIR